MSLQNQLQKVTFVQESMENNLSHRLIVVRKGTVQVEENGEMVTSSYELAEDIKGFEYIKYN